MSKTAEAEPTAAPEEEVTDLVEGTHDARQDAARRASDCWEEVHAVLQKYRCRIIPQISPEHIEPVGKTGGTIQITASYGIFPLA